MRQRVARRGRACLTFMAGLVVAIGIASGFVSVHRDRVIEYAELRGSIRSPDNPPPTLDLSGASLSFNEEPPRYQVEPPLEKTVPQYAIGDGCLSFIVHDGPQWDHKPDAWHVDTHGSGWTWRWERRPVMGPGTLYVVPMWPLAAALVSAALLAWTPAIRRASRRRSNRCPSCGYDRRGLAAAACPECGFLITSAG